MSIAKFALVSSLGLLLWHLAVAKEPSPFEKLQVEVKDVIDPFYADIRANYKYRQEEPISPEDMPKWLILYFNEKIGPNKQHVTASVAEQSLDRLSDAFLTDFFYFFPKLSTEVTKENLIYLNQKYFHPRELALTLFKVLASQDEELFNRFSKILRDDLDIQKREMQKAYEVGEIIGRLYPKASKSQKWEHEIGFAKEYHESKLKDMRERFVKMMELYRLMWSKNQFQKLVTETGCYYLSYFWSFRKNVLPQEDIALSADQKYKADLLRQVGLFPDISREEHQETVIARWQNSSERKAMLTLFQTLYVEGVTDSIAHLKKELLRFEDLVAKTDPEFLPSGGTSEDFREFEEEAAQVEKLPRSWEKPHTLHFMGRDTAGTLIVPYAYTENFFLSLVKASSDSNQSEEYGSDATETLGKIGEKAITALVKALGDKRGMVRFHAIHALGKMGEKAIPALIKALGDSDETVRASAARALGIMGEKAAPAIPALIKALGDSDKIVRASAARASGKIGEKAIPALIKALGDSDETVRVSAANALGEMREKADAAIPTLIKALSDSNKVVRLCAAHALGKIGEKAAPAIPALIKALGDSESEVRAFAAGALGKMGEKAENAIPALIKALGDSDEEVHTHAADALQKMGEKGQDALRDWKEKNK